MSDSVPTENDSKLQKKKKKKKKKISFSFFVQIEFLSFLSEVFFLLSRIEFSPTFFVHVRNVYLT